jgi:hypothetical protein
MPIFAFFPDRSMQWPALAYQGRCEALLRGRKPMITLRPFQKHSTTTWILNGVYGSVNRGDLGLCLKRARLCENY